MQKRGDIQYDVLIEALLVVLVGVALFSYVRNLGNDTLFEQNFLARDVALTIDAAYAAPGNVSITYDTTIKSTEKLRFAFGDSKVLVFTGPTDVLYQNPASYVFGEDRNLKFSPPADSLITNLGKTVSGFTVPNVRSDILLTKSELGLSLAFTEVQENELNEAPAK